MPPSEIPYNFLLFILFVLAILAGIVWLQIFLSKKDDKWPGLILPAITFGCSLLVIFSYAVYEGMTNWDIFIALGMLFLLCNIPTLILLAIYLACREKNKRSKELEKMNISDLE